MALMLIWCLPAAFALGMYRAHLTSRGRETGLQSFRVRPVAVAIFALLLWHSQCVQDGHG